jgi:hypothetical protein
VPKLTVLCACSRPVQRIAECARSAPRFGSSYCRPSLHRLQVGIDALARDRLDRRGHYPEGCIQARRSGSRPHPELILQGRYAEARTVFERLLARCNDVGLFAEELDPLSGRMLGNFPQAYSHVGLINCALNLSRQTGPMEERAESQTPAVAMVPAASTPAEN